MKLFIYEHCPFCVRARMIFGLKNLPVEQSIIMEGDVDTPTRMVGRKVVPILQKEDGSFMPESMDIVHYVDSKQAPLIANRPVDADIEAWCKSVSNAVFNLAVPRFTKADFKEISTPEARHAYTQREEKAFGDLDALIAKTPELIAEVEQKLDALEPRLASVNAISTTDFILFPILLSLTIVKGVQFGPNVHAYLKRVSTASKVALLTDKAL
ncbi:glutaredoxin 2 [Pectobacterium araliae]|uniref:Glutaredoxin 2 n=1 Tax=Pectobacterium araliae TaxID=3073862 RepID=A0AAN0MM68_9GAMM|nr:glutaredoxin 2 [Pectobacterium sp. MAFF 302110]GKW22339.1 glutaredoxin 2 [Pectobacterium carotovorum subsp. carotovorum]